MSDQITVIQAPGRRLTKLHRREVTGEVITEGYDDTKMVLSREVEIASIRDIARLLRELEGQPECAVIRGRRRVDAPAGKVRRAKFTDRDGAAPGFEPAPRRWMCVDLDGVACPPELEPAADPERAILHLLTLLPDWLRFASCAYQWSSSAGVRGWSTLKAHLWFWLDRAVDDESLRAWARATPAVDPAVYEAIQIHYTAAPILHAVADPLAGHRRTGLLQGGLDTVEVPEEVWGWRQREEAARQARREEAARRQVEARIRSAAGEDPRKASWLQNGLAACRSDLLAGSDPGSRHDTALRVAGSLANYVTWGYMEPGDARAILDFSPIADDPSRDDELDRVWDHALRQAEANPSPEPTFTSELRVARSRPVTSVTLPPPQAPPRNVSPGPSPRAQQAEEEALEVQSAADQRLFTEALERVTSSPDPKVAVVDLLDDDALFDAALRDERGFERLLLQLEDAGVTKARLKTLRDEVARMARRLRALGPGDVDILRPGDGWPDSDDRMALRLVEREGWRMRHAVGMGWLVFEGGVWRRDPGTVVRLARESARALREEVDAAWPEDFARYPQPAQRPWNQLATFARGAEGEGRINAAANLARVDPQVVAEPSAFDADPWLLNTANGTIDLRTGVHRPHAPSDLLTMQTAVAWDEAATCPMWERFLLEIMDNDPGMVAFLQRVVGYTLTGSTREQCFFLLQGIGSNGKSTFVDTLMKLMSGYSKSAQFQTFADTKANQDVRNDIADLRGSRLVSAVEPDEGVRLAEGVVKQLTGGDAIKARFLYQEAFEFYPTFKVFLSCNPLPVIRGTDNGIWRRVRLIQFPRRYRVLETDPESWPEADRELPGKLLQELPGILRWAVEGCMAWQEQGLAPPLKVLNATRSYRQEQDILGQFTEECCVIAEGVFVSAAELYDAYQAWCQREGHKYPLAANRFGSKLREAHPTIEPFRSKTMRGYRGIGLLAHSSGGGPL